MCKWREVGVRQGMGDARDASCTFLDRTAATLPIIITLPLLEE